MASIDFNDGAARTLSNGLSGAFGRFRAWLPSAPFVGARHHALGSGTPYAYQFRPDDVASFAIEELTAAMLDTATRLQRHLRNAGVITINTTDSANRVYTATLAEGGDVTLEGPNQYYRYTLKLTVRNTAAAPLLCTY
jgi:hypothetical protein